MGQQILGTIDITQAERDTAEDIDAEDSSILETLFLAAPIAFKGRLEQYVGRILRPHPDKSTAEVHDYHDVHTGVLASSLNKRVPGYVRLGFVDPRKVS